MVGCIIQLPRPIRAKCTCRSKIICHTHMKGQIANQVGPPLDHPHASIYQIWMGGLLFIFQ